MDKVTSPCEQSARRSAQPFGGMSKIGIVAATWVAAVAAITYLFATERIAWPELWLLGATVFATAAAAYFAPRHHWRWVVGSPVIGVVVTAATWLVVFGFLSHHSQVTAESWLVQQFNGAPLVAPDEATCSSGTTTGKACSLGDLAKRHGGVTSVDCYDNIPLAVLGWECRADFHDGTSIALDAWSTWTKRSAHIGGEGAL
jgi:hypothetical protein